MKCLLFATYLWNSKEIDVIAKFQKLFWIIGQNIPAN